MSVRQGNRHGLRQKVCRGRRRLGRPNCRHLVWRVVVDCARDACRQTRDSKACLGAKVARRKMFY